MLVHGIFDPRLSASAAAEHGQLGMGVLEREQAWGFGRCLTEPGRLVVDLEAQCSEMASFLGVETGEWLTPAFAVQTNDQQARAMPGVHQLRSYRCQDHSPPRRFQCGAIHRKDSAAA